MRSAICLGHGYVGKATAKAFGIEDWYAKNSRSVEELFDLVAFRYIFVCLPTPTVEGKQDISIIEGYFKELTTHAENNIFIMRSTVLPGTCKYLADTYKVKIVHVPEFLTEATWEEDSKWPDIVVVGGDDKKSRDEVTDLFKSRYKGSSFFVTNSVTSELIKYGVNTLYALKVVFANQVFDYADKVGANYETFKRALYARKWVGQNHLDVWNKGGRGASGKCLKKDLEAFSSFTGLPLLKVANELNLKYLHDSHK